MSLNRIMQSVDLERFPIDALESEQGRRFLDDCFSALEADGTLVLEGFLKESVVREIVENVVPIINDAYFCQTEHNVYLIEDDNSFSENHPRNRSFKSSKGLLAYDQIPQDNFLRELYEWSPLRAFIARLMKAGSLYPYVDPLSPINVNVNMDGQQLNWHYDNAEFTTTLMLRPAKEGGVYEYVPFIRSPHKENFDALEAVLDEKASGVKSLHQGAGALVIFKGKYTVHRVTPTVGPSRLVAVMAFSPEPGKTITARTRQIFYGREE